MKGIVSHIEKRETAMAPRGNVYKFEVRGQHHSR